MHNVTVKFALVNCQWSVMIVHDSCQLAAS